MARVPFSEPKLSDRIYFWLGVKGLLEELWTRGSRACSAAAAALTAATTAQAATPATSTLPAATSYRDLLNPIPNALALLKTGNTQRPQTPETRVAETVVIKKKGHHYHHHHHHHHHHSD
jgi:hypothetical protein